jgi:formate dehydrogenase (coenzyme F420) alpha subunit
VQSVLTTCPFCSCGCGLYLQATGKRPGGSAPSANHPVSRGTLCARGWNAHEAVAWGERLTQPLVRRERGLRPVTWEEALAETVRLLFGVLGSGGAVGVLGSARATNEENFLAARLARSVLETPHVDSCLRATYTPAVDGLAEVTGSHRLAGTLAEVERAEVIVLIEGDLARTHPRAAHAVLEALTRGARLITIGVARTQMSRLAALHLSAAPGEHSGVIARLARALLAASAAHPPAARLDPRGYGALRESVADLAAADESRTAAGWLADARRTAALVATTTFSVAQERANARGVASLLALTGHLGQPGSPLIILPLRGNLRGACEMGVAPDRLPGHAPLTDEVVRQRLRNLWGRIPVATTGLAAEAIVDRLAGVLIVAEDPGAVLALGKRAQEALGRMSCVIVLDAFATASVAAADVVLPIASFAESEGSVTNLEGRVQAVRPCGRPPGEARHGWQVLAEISSRLGVPTFCDSPLDILRQIAAAVPGYARVSDVAFTPGWGSLTAGPNGGRLQLHEFAMPAPAPAPLSFRLAWDELFDWGSDPLVRFSPTLCRDHSSRRKLFPHGWVEMSTADADRLGLRQGWAARLGSPRGTSTVPVVVRGDLEPGTLLAPFALRDQLGELMNREGVAAVTVEKA